MFDVLESFYFPSANVRGYAVRLQKSWQGVLERRALPAPVQSLLGEMTASAVMLAGAIRFNGPVLLQVAGDGPVRLAMAEVQPGLGFRATVRMNAGEGVPAQGSSMRDLVNRHGRGRCALTLVNPDPAQRTQSYQGIVDIAGSATIAEALARYMTLSEQVETGLWLSADATGAAGLMLQKVAGEGGRETPADPDGWNRLMKLAGTVTGAELLSLEPRTLLQRLFWQESPLVAEPREPAFECSCSRERVAGMIRSLGEAEAREILAERGEIEITCEFCGKNYSFDSIDVHQIFEDRAAEGSDTRN